MFWSLKKKKKKRKRKEKTEIEERSANVFILDFESSIYYTSLSLQIDLFFFAFPFCMCRSWVYTIAIIYDIFPLDVCCCLLHTNYFIESAIVTEQDRFSTRPYHFTAVGILICWTYIKSLLVYCLILWMNFIFRFMNVCAAWKRNVLLLVCCQFLLRIFSDDEKGIINKWTAG